MLRRYRGYECQELQGEFMLAFGCPADAILWSGAVQVQMSDHALKWEDRNKFNISIGIEMGVPISVEPHRSSGRADYFGNIVNHTARIAKSAHGGQILLGSEAWKNLHTCTSMQTFDKPTGLGVPYVYYNLGRYWYKGISESTLIVEARPYAHVDKILPPIKAKMDENPSEKSIPYKGYFSKPGRKPYVLMLQEASESKTTSIRDTQSLNMKNYYSNVSEEDIRRAVERDFAEHSLNTHVL